ncbi:MAG: tryptophan synthase subunit beta [Armatimonadetes bacterium]|nr:tryptophan synthase subunit beta [Armatimonadota bacterium]MBX3109894.1 tryptophan synthase subunit beta [Fimbriimonadaceae bacterium]
MAQPSAPGRFGDYGGRYVPETLVPALDELDAAFREAWVQPDFRAEFEGFLRDYVGRPTPLTEAPRISAETGYAVSVKREDLNHTGAHKINNALGQCLLAKRMGKTRIIAETGAGQHGVATATICARLNLECVVYMGEEDTERQRLNVFRMKLLGAEVIPVSSGTKTLKDALNEAMRDWVANVRDTHYVIGTAAGPHPYPYMVREFQSVIGKEARAQYLERHGCLPDTLVACVGGGSNAIGFFHAFVGDPSVCIFGVEAGGDGVATGRHAAPLSAGRPGVLHGSYSYLMQDGDGQILPTASVSAGLDYPGVGAEHSYLKDSGRVEYLAVTDDEALDAFRWLSQMEGLIPAFESAHAIALLRKGLWEPGTRVLVNLSGRGDKDMERASQIFNL